MPSDTFSSVSESCQRVLQSPLTRYERVDDKLRAGYFPDPDEIERYNALLPTIGEDLRDAEAAIAQVRHELYLLLREHDKLSVRQASYATIPGNMRNLPPGLLEDTSPGQQALVADMRLLEDRIESLTTAMDQLEARQATLQRLQECYHAYTAPIRRLPPEILQDIFSIGRSFFSWTSYSAATYIDTAATVCRHWRDVIMAMPSLHTWIVLLPGQLSNVPRQLQYSSKLPLRIYIGHFTKASDVNPALVLLASHSKRWERLRIDNARAIVASLAPRMRDAPVALTTLTLHGSTVDPYHTHWVNMAFSGAKQLKHVTIHHLNNRMACVPDTVRSLKTQICSTRSVLDVLKRCSKLRKLESDVTLDDLPPNAKDEEDVSPIVTPSLRTVQLGSGEEMETEDKLLSRVTLPALRTLSLTCHTVGSALYGLFHRSMAPLRDLTISAHTVDEESLAQAFPFIPALRKLKLTVHHLRTDKLIRALQIRPQTVPPCPNLVDLVIWTVGAVRPVQPDVLADVLESRVATAMVQIDEPRVAGLRLVRLRRIIPIHTVVPARLKALEEQGMTLTIDV
ncbi:uncharacterized protein SCHCODRAFT_02745727 [Schizophyllum commune H4-8]|nr:uncharacterized protein SCHCODRAFT_02745727 [Schizophyllum commune H4-8]KAI5896825.1 hypothetical protein SCHCODRAFT_02745727 [Schizophyllum commune H4-8]